MPWRFLSRLLQVAFWFPYQTEKIFFPPSNPRNLVYFIHGGRRRKRILLTTYIFLDLSDFNANLEWKRILLTDVMSTNFTIAATVANAYIFLWLSDFQANSRIGEFDDVDVVEYLCKGCCVLVGCQVFYTGAPDLLLWRHSYRCLTTHHHRVEKTTEENTTLFNFSIFWLCFSQQHQYSTMIWLMKIFDDDNNDY